MRRSLLVLVPCLAAVSCGGATGPRTVSCPTAVVPPTGTRGPDKYELGRATIIVYNWAHQGTVSVDVSGAVPMGGDYAVHAVEDFYGAAVASGTYGGGSIAVPMAAVAPGPDFGVFVLTSAP